MKKLITLLLSLVLGAFALFGTGCSEYYQTSGGGTLPSGGGEAPPGGEETPDGDPFTVKLHTTDGGGLPSLSGIYAQWTEINGVDVYRASFNAEGIATSYKPDGEYHVTLSDTPVGYTYDPNLYFADNTSNDKTIALYPLREYTGSGNQPPDHASINATGAYRFVFDKPSREFYFNFGTTYSGKMSFQSLLDVTANEVSPIFYKAGTSNYWGAPVAVRGGGTSNTYTKNFKYTCDLTGSQDILFKIGVETVNPKAFPIYIDVLIQREGEYTQTGVGLEMVAPPTDLDDDSENMPTGTFTVIADMNDKLFDESMVVYDEADDRYYLKNSEGNADKSKMLYAMLKNDLPGILTTNETATGTGLSYPEVRHSSYETGKNYTQFIAAYFAKANQDGSYPVTAQLKEYLYDFAQKTPMFFDGLGSAETGGGYQVVKIESQWLFACGFYQ